MAMYSAASDDGPGRPGPRKKPVEELVDGSWQPLWRSWIRAMRAEHLSPHTIEARGYALAKLQGFLRGRGELPNPCEVPREDIQDFMAWMGEAGKSAKTARDRFGDLRRWFRWLEEEGELDHVPNPMAGMKAPHVPEADPPVLTVDVIRRMLDTCTGRDFASRRDTALIRFAADTGARRGEMALQTISQHDLDLDAQAARLVGKGRKIRVVSIGDKLVRDLDRYLRARDAHPHARDRLPVALLRNEEAPALWLGVRGPMTGSGIYQTLRARAQQAGIEERVFAHAFRSTAADMLLDDGASDDAVMTLMGWDSLTMLRRYTRRRRAERARAEHRRHSPGDRI
jgi:integrase/recombinase XerC